MWRRTFLFWLYFLPLYPSMVFRPSSLTSSLTVLLHFACIRQLLAVSTRAGLRPLRTTHHPWKSIVLATFVHMTKTRIL